MAAAHRSWSRRVLESPPGEEMMAIPSPGRAFGCLPTAGCLGLIVIFFLGVLVPIHHDTLGRCRITDCKNNLKQLGIYLQRYVARFGDDVHYPTTAEPEGAGGKEWAAGPNGAFWSHLSRPPGDAAVDATGAKRRSVWMRPGEDGLACCKAFRGRVAEFHGGYTAVSLDYAGPRLENSGAFPNGRLSDRVAGNTFIGGDLLGAEGGPNHGGTPGAPLHVHNALALDGSVRQVAPGMPEFDRFLRETDTLVGGVRTR